MFVMVASEASGPETVVELPANIETEDEARQHILDTYDLGRQKKLVLYDAARIEIDLQLCQTIQAQRLKERQHQEDLESRRRVVAKARERLVEIDPEAEYRLFEELKRKFGR